MNLKAEYPKDDLSLLPADEKKRRLFQRQKLLLDTFLSHGAITEAQYRKSLGDLTEKMGMRGVH